MGWKDRFTFRERHFVTHEVGGIKFNFYPNRIALLHELAEVSKPIATALGALFADQSRDTASAEKVMLQGDTTIKETTLQSISPELAAHRAKERDDALKALLDAVSDPRNRLLIGKLLMDSLRDEFPFARDRHPGDVEEFLYGDGKDYAGLDTPALSGMVQGWIKANAKVFGPAGEMVAAQLKGQLGGIVAPLSASPSENPEQPSGSSSKTPSSPQPATAST